MSPMKNTARLAMDMVLPDMFWLMPGKPSTTASITTSTITPAISRMNAGITGVNAPQLLFELLDESVIFLHY